MTFTAPLADDVEIREKTGGLIIIQSAFYLHHLKLLTLNTPTYCKVLLFFWSS